jgi:hypothetical protein
VALPGQTKGQKRPTTVSKETYYSVKRDLLQCQKRPTTVSKETCYSVKRDLLQCQKRPTTVSKETYYSVKRGRNAAHIYQMLVYKFEKNIQKNI